MNIIKNAFTALFLLISLSSFAQFSDSYNYYLYIPLGETPQSCTSNIYYVHFNRDEKVYCSTITKSTLKSKYDGGVIDEYAINKSHDYKYDYDMSTYKYEVYVKKTYTQRTFGPGIPLHDGYTGAPVMDHTGYSYYAFSLDRQEMITWRTSKNDNTPKQKKYYKLVEIEDIVPPPTPANYDFLR